MSVDAVGRQGLSPLQKCTAAIRMLAYGSPADSVDEYVRIGESTAIECLKNFVEGSNNDITVLNQSPVFNEVLRGAAPMVKFRVNETMYHMGYYLADGIYPEWGTFVKTIPMPQGEKKQKFAKRQEAARKDVERAFGVLQSRFAIVNNDISDAEVLSGPIPAFRNMLERRAHQIEKSIHRQLQADLVEHIWELPEIDNNET
ncbi:uncharacterized protein LOC130719363 [Lotus japonicus]|uniref:uncharacterized protein LOC130719360 n=1 Tax=Lotus japonicus TaxID=34305 RepID=UPI00258D16C8|nr:uncharacterized protein LOC130719360 [Lotus japonicus]XP_057425971.1 uncharacterized protein LOC130719363 [Lotus japonicus]